MTLNFAEMTDIEIIDFVTANSHYFAEEFKKNFGADTKYGVRAGNVLIIRNREGFAIVENGSNEEGWERPARLLIIYVSTEHRGTRIARALINQVKLAVIQGIPINLQCEGDGRKQKFARFDFAVIDSFGGMGTYEMQYKPSDETPPELSA
jgi:GNAT superfamily N-acetyltransferase